MAIRAAQVEEVFTSTLQSNHSRRGKDTGSVDRLMSCYTEPVTDLAGQALDSSTQSCVFIATSNDELKWLTLASSHIVNNNL